VDLHDAGMLQAGDRFGLLPEARPLALAGVSADQDHLQGHGAAEPAVAGLVDDTHASTTDEPHDLVTGHLRLRGHFNRRGRSGRRLLAAEGVRPDEVGRLVRPGFAHGGDAQPGKCARSAFEYILAAAGKHP
jgi:hypothetical protein